MRSLILIILFSLFQEGCSKSNLPEFNKLESIRVLAFQIATPEVNPGATVTVTPIISDVSAATMTYSASVCIDPGLSYGAEPTCEGNPSKVVIATNTALAAPGVAESWTGAADSFVVNIPAQPLIFIGRNAVEQYNGMNYLIDYTLTNDLGKSVRAIKRIVVSDPAKTSKNANPVTTNIFADGNPLTTLPLGTTIALTTDLTLASSESYTLQNNDGTFSVRAEKLITTWFITDGKTKYFHTGDLDSNKYDTPGALPGSRSAYLIAVTHDDRGGVSFVKKKF